MRSIRHSAWKWGFAMVVLAGMLAMGMSPETPDGSEAELKLPLEPVRVIEWTTNEGTWVSVDISPDGQTIVFDLLGDIYTVPARGGTARALTRGMAWDSQPRFSPDGQWIAFLSDRSGSDNVWIMRSDGSDLRAVTREKDSLFGSPEWTPDGRFIVVRKWGPYPGERDLLRRIELWIYHRDGGKGMRLLKDHADIVRVSGVSFSPDGRYMYFSAARERFRYNADPTVWQVYRLDRKTGEVQQIMDRYGGSLRPRVSPDGRFLVYATRRDGRTGLRIRDLRTGEERWLAYPIQRDDQEGFTAEDLLPGYNFTRDSRAIVIAYGGKIHRIDIASRRDTIIPFIARVRQELGPLVRFTRSVEDGPLAVRQLRWPNLSPDGRFLVFSAVGKIWLVQLPDGRPQRLTRDEKHKEYAPRFSPDGRWIAYVTWSDDEGGHIWIVPAEGGSPRRLTRTSGYYDNPVWTPDGRRIVFVRATRPGWLAQTRADIRELRWMPVAPQPTESHLITYVRSATALPTVSDDGQWVYYSETSFENRKVRTTLYGVRIDGADKSPRLRFEGPVRLYPSPDGRWVVCVDRGYAYLMPVPKDVGQVVTVSLQKPPFPTRILAREGAGYFVWSADSSTLTWGFANEVYRVDRATVWHAAESTWRPDTWTVTWTVPRAKPSGWLALRGARIIPMEGDRVIERGDILIRDHRIVAVGPSGQVRIPPAATVIDLTGKTVVPGFIDLHAHMRPQPDVFVDKVWSYAANLAYGVTTTRDPSIDSFTVFPYAEMVEAGIVLGPRIYSTGTAMTTRAVRIDSLEDARHHVRRYKRHGAVFLKEYMQPRRIVRQWLVMAAQEEGIHITAEGGGELRLDLSLVLDGYTGFEHSLPVVPIYRDVIELIARAGTTYTPTLVVSYGGPFGQHYYRQKTDIHAMAKVRRFTPHEALDRVARRRRLIAEDDYHFPLIAKGAAEIFKRGGHIAVGAHGEQQGIGFHWELWMLAMGGLTPLETLRVATVEGAHALGFERDLGSITPGKIADLVVLDGNPLEDIHHTASVVYVIKNGFLYDADSMDQIWPEQKPFGPFYWQRDEDDLRRLTADDSVRGSAH